MSAIYYSENEIKAMEWLMRESPTYFTREVSAILVLMYARESCMVRESLTAFLSNYPYLNNRQCVSDSLNILLGKDYLVQQRDIGTGFYKIKINDNIIQMLKTSYGQNVSLLEQSREKLECIKTFGKTNSNDNSSLFYKRMQQAQNEISIVYIATEPYISTVSVLKSILTNVNVKIKLLVANDEICRRLRGVNSPAQKWYEEFKEFKNFEIRVYNSIEGTQIATSTLVDQKVLRMTVFDIMKQRTADGYMLEIVNMMGYEMNLIQIYCEKFNKIWQEADIYKENRIIRLIKKPLFINFVICIFCFGLYLFILKNTGSPIIIPTIFGFFLEKIMESVLLKIKELRRR